MSPITSIDDLDYEGDYEETEQESISNICFQIFNSITNCYVGTAFLIKTDGHFLSAGHNFKNRDPKCAYFNNVKYEIREIYKDYSEDEGKDFFLGKLDNFDNFDDDDTLDYTLSEEDLEVDSSVLFYGYNSNRFNTDTYLNVNGCTLYAHKEKAKLVSLEEKKAILEEVISSCSESEAATIRSRLNYDPRLQSEIEGIKFLNIYPCLNFYGISGGPIYFENKIYGVFIADMFVPSRYIIETLKAKRFV